MSVKDTPKNTNNGEDRTFPGDDKELRMKYFNKEFGYRSTVFRCTICLTPRKYGEHGKPEQTMALILCEGTCRKHTWHSYIGLLGRGDSNYAGISNNP